MREAGCTDTGGGDRDTETDAEIETETVRMRQRLEGRRKRETDRTCERWGEPEIQRLSDTEMEEEREIVRQGKTGKADRER